MRQRLLRPFVLVATFIVVPPFWWPSLPLAARVAQPSAQGDLDAEANRLWRAGHSQEERGALAEAASSGEALVAILKRIGPDADNNLLATYDWLSDVLEQTGEYSRALACQEESLPVFARQPGMPEWQTADRRRAVERLRRIVALSASDRRDLAQASRQQESAYRLEESGKAVEAILVVAETLRIRQRILGAQDLDTATSLNSLGLLYGQTGDPTRGEPLAQQALAIRRSILGPRHPDTAASLNNLANFALLKDDYARALSLSLEALAMIRAAVAPSDSRLEQFEERADSFLDKLQDEVTVIERSGNYAKAVLLQESALAATQTLFGANSRQATQAQEKLNRLRGLVGRFSPDRQEREMLLQMYQSARDRYESGRLRDAIALMTTVVEQRRSLFGSRDADTAAALNYLGVFYEDAGDVTRAEACLREALDIRTATLGADDSDTAASINNLGTLYYLLGDSSRAETLFRQAKATFQEQLGESFLTNIATNNLAMVRFAGLVKPIVWTVREARDIDVADRQFDAAWRSDGLAQLAAFRMAMGRTSAEALYEEALKLRRDAFGNDHPAVARSFTDLAGYYEAVGDLKHADENHDRALKLRSRLLGADHPDNVPDLVGLGFGAAARGNIARAERLYVQALSISRRHVDLAATVQSTRQQLAILAAERVGLDRYLSLVTTANAPAAGAWEQAAAWKGSILSRQRLERVVSQRPELRATWKALQETSSELATAAFMTPSPGNAAAWRTRTAALSERQERLQVELSRATGVAGGTATNASAVAGLLPADAAFVDIFEYVHSSTAQALPPRSTESRQIRGLPRTLVGSAPTPTHDITEERRFVAFVVRKDRPVRLVRLGPSKRIADATREWRRAIAEGSGKAAPAAELRSFLWVPIETALDGERPRQVIVSLDGVLGQLPLHALPGRTPGTFLIQDWVISTVPNARFLVEMVPKPPRTTAASLLLVGDVDYGVKNGVGRHAAIVGSNTSFERLSGTKAEIDRIEALHDEAYPSAPVMRLSEMTATRTALIHAVPEYRFLHFATHGFFAAEQFKSALDRGIHEASPGSQTNQSLAGYAPGLLSGLVLAGANAPTTQDDGIVTSEEIASLDLSNTDLAVLSACESGLGQVAAGEGLLGLQRAFHAAGASSVVASLWSVPDPATRALMQQFYMNLWKKGMARLEALREAQLWMIREGVTRYQQSSETRTVGDTRASRAGTPGDAYYWAAFELSGDWR